MSCYHPIPAYQHKTARREETGKKVITFKDMSRNSAWEEIQLPCGQCIGCRLDYSREWANRIVMEASQYKENYFLTLTYDPEHVPIGSAVNLETGELTQGLTLVPKDLVDFMKRLRRHWEYNYHWQGIRFYGCGEYGSQTERPHYHICVMNFPIKEKNLTKLFVNKSGDTIYDCEEIKKIWGKGLISVGTVTWDSAAYVARYMLKKQKGPEADQYYRSQGKAPEFTRMSNRPGIGAGYYEQNKERIYEYDSITLPKRRTSITVKPPAYFDKLYDLDDPENLEKIKEERAKTAKRNEALKDRATTLYPWQRRTVEENRKKEQLKKLPRTLD